MMNNFRTAQMVLLIALAASIALTVAGMKSCNEPVVVNKWGEWDEPPEVILCDSSTHSFDDVLEVVSRYEERGHKFGDIIELSMCPEENVPGWIVIKDAGTKIRYSEMGHAHSKFNTETGKILSSSIETRKDSDILVLEHEMGHALGYDHVNRSGHIMSSSVSELGPNDSGLYIKF